MNDKDTHGDKQRLAEIDRRLDKLQAQREEKDRPGRSALPEGMAAIMGRVATSSISASARKLTGPILSRSRIRR